MTITADRIWQSTRLILRDPDDSRFTLERFADALNAALADFTNNVDYFIKTVYTELPANYNQINFGDRATKIIRVEYNDTQRSNIYKLPPTGYERLDYEYSNWRQEMESGYPRYVVVNKQNDCQFFVYPMARRVSVDVPLFGIVESTSGDLETTDDFGVIEGLNVPFLTVLYAERQRPLQATTDNSIVFIGETNPAQFEIQEDVMHCLKHYCAAVMLSDDDEKAQGQKAASNMSLYNRTLQQIKEKKAMGYNTDTIEGYYNNGDNLTSTSGGRHYYYGSGYYG